MTKRKRPPDPNMFTLRTSQRTLSLLVGTKLHQLQVQTPIDPKIAILQNKNPKLNLISSPSTFKGSSLNLIRTRIIVLAFMTPTKTLNNKEKILITKVNMNIKFFPFFAKRSGFNQTMKYKYF